MKIGLTLAGLLLMSAVSFSQTVKIDGIRPDQVATQGFKLSSPTKIKIEGSGAVFSDDWRLLVYYGWIINADSRKVVWHLFDFMKETKANEANGIYDFTSEMELPAGTYELYYAGMHDNESYHGWGDSWSVDDFGDVIDKFFYSVDRERFQISMVDELQIKVSGSGVSAVDSKNSIERKASEAIVSFNRVQDDVHLQQGFTLSDDAKIRLYAIGEGRKKEIYDYFWITDASTRERVYKMDYMNTSYAGGAKKNLVTDEVITLKKGSYVVHYVTDDSHSYERWNALPPDDLEFWGVTLWPATPEDRKKVQPFVQPKGISSVVELAQVRNSELRSTGISLSKETQLRLLCLGEVGNDDTMVDYGWIADATTKEKVWRMKVYRSEHAGGAMKNRLVSEIITLPAGDYIVYYATDGSHAFGSWNDSKPHDEDLWGMTLWPVKEEDGKTIKVFDPKSFKNAGSLVEILMVGDYESRREDFVLEKSTKIRILAVGEGDEGEMYDYGYIKNVDTDKIVWEMEYENSTHAGGAHKNREFSESIILAKGNYRLYFKTDGSHSYRRWNSSPPANEEGYGIMIIKEEGI